MVESDFVKGVKMIMDAAEGLEVERTLHIGLALMANAYHQRLVRSANRIESEEEVLAHLNKYLPPALYPGDMRAEKEPLK